MSNTNIGQPVGYSAIDTHAVCATAGVHPCVPPGGILYDVTDRGPRRDPSLDMYSDIYEYQWDHLATSNLTPGASCPDDAPLLFPSCLTVCEEPFTYQFGHIQAARRALEDAGKWDKEALAQYEARLIEEPHNWNKEALPLVQYEARLFEEALRT